MPRWLSGSIVSTAILIALGQAWPGLAWPADAVISERAAEPDLVTLNFVNAEIAGVAKIVGEITGKNFLIDPRVKGSIDIISARPVSKALVYEIFLSALRLQGFAVVENRGVITILPEADAKLHRGGGARGGGDQIQTRVFALSHESVVDMLPTLRPLITANNTITAVQNSNTLIITDYASNLARIARIIEAIDQPAATDAVMIPLYHASALDAAVTINRLFAEGAQAPQAMNPALRTTIVADGRSNSLLVRASDPSRMGQIRQLAAMLDTPTSTAGNIHVVYLKNAEAVKVAETLRGIFTGDTGPTGASSAMGATQPGMPPPSTSLSAGIIQADAATNSIIITAPDAIYNNLRAVLERLDVRRLQVYVEALIVEITASKAAEFGIQWQDLGGLGQTGSQVFGGTNFGGVGQNIIGVAQNPTAVGPGLNVGVVNGTVTVGGVQILNLGVLVRALANDNNANILSTPTLLSLDNEDAKIVIGQNVPFITGQYAISGASTTPSPFQTIERKDVGLTLRIRPQISEGGLVRLQIFQEVSSIADTSNAAGVITNKRSVETTVLANDGQIIVIGGLMQDSVSDGISKVPVLGDIPVLGGLFRQNTRSRTKTNLMVFLRPTVLRDAQSADSLTNDRYAYIRGQQFDAAPASHAILPNFPSPLLPELPGNTRAATGDPR